MRTGGPYQPIIGESGTGGMYQPMLPPKKGGPLPMPIPEMPEMPEFAPPEEEITGGVTLPPGQGGTMTYLPIQMDGYKYKKV